MKESFFDQRQLPLVLQPDGDTTKNTLISYLQDNNKELYDKLYKHGAILLRGFDIESPKDFEEVAKAVDSELKNDYLGTSPRDKIGGTDFIFSASELPNFYPIMQHCEMSFLKYPPNKLFFYCAVEPQYGGETPICNFREVYKQLDKNIREEFERKGLTTIRNYSGLNTKSSFNLWELKRWDQMFLTTDKKEIEKKCNANGIEYEWRNNDNLRLINRNKASQAHPVTGDVAWFNHTQVFHVAASAIEYSKIHERQGRAKTLFYKLFTSIMVGAKKALTKADEQSMHVTFGDGSAIPDSYVKHLEEVIWKNLVIFPWKKNDLIVIDNLSTSHGRMPYEGPRQILVCWSA
jgi:alpha-ketoglutarate-dependent taurine dioxygenase